MKSPLRFWAQPATTQFGFDLFIWGNKDDKYYQYDVVLKGVEKEEGTMLSGPANNLQKEEAQDLLDALWNAGIRPTYNNRDYDAELKATRAHLEDMRLQVFQENYKPIGGR